MSYRLVVASLCPRPSPLPRLYKRLAKRRRTRAIGEFVARRCTTVKQASGPRGPKKHMKDTPFVWADHVDFLSAHAFRRCYRMDIGAFSKLKTKIAPHLTLLNAEMARLSRKAGAIAHEVTLAVTLLYLAGGAMEDIFLINRLDRCCPYSALWHGISTINIAHADNSYQHMYMYMSLEKMHELEADLRAHTRQEEIVNNNNLHLIIRDAAPSVCVS